MPRSLALTMTIAITVAMAICSGARRGPPRSSSACPQSASWRWRRPANGLLAPELAAGIQRVKSAKSIGVRAATGCRPSRPKRSSTRRTSRRSRGCATGHHRRAPGLRFAAAGSRGACDGAHTAAGWPVVHRGPLREAQARLANMRRDLCVCWSGVFADLRWVCCRWRKRRSGGAFTRSFRIFGVAARRGLACPCRRTFLNHGWCGMSLGGIVLAARA
jgi:hypothetical protein